ncbi:MAG: hypothetical protein R3A78_01405 [Polyangiales bacterium]
MHPFHRLFHDRRGGVSVSYGAQIAAALLGIAGLGALGTAFSDAIDIGAASAAAHPFARPAGAASPGLGPRSSSPSVATQAAVAGTLRSLFGGLAESVRPVYLAGYDIEHVVGRALVEADPVSLGRLHVPGALKNAALDAEHAVSPAPREVAEVVRRMSTAAPDEASEFLRAHYDRALRRTIPNVLDAVHEQYLAQFPATSDDRAAWLTRYNRARAYTDQLAARRKISPANLWELSTRYRAALTGKDVNELHGVTPVFSESLVPHYPWDSPELVDVVLAADGPVALPVLHSPPLAHSEWITGLRRFNDGTSAPEAEATAMRHAAWSLSQLKRPHANLEIARRRALVDATREGSRLAVEDPATARELRSLLFRTSTDTRVSAFDHILSRVRDGHPSLSTEARAELPRATSVLRHWFGVGR